MPLRVLWRGTQGTKAESRILGLAIAQLQRIAEDSGATRIVVGGVPADATLDALGRVCQAADGTASIASHACVDLSKPVDALRADVRGSYRSLLNWGQRSLSLSY